MRPGRSDEVFDNAPAPSRTKAPAAAFASDPAASRVEPDAVPARPSRARTVDEDDLPLTWEPRVVPLPTYAMKARVEHRLVDETVESTGTAGDQLAELPAWDDDLVALRPRAAHG